jgi:ubiquinone/menaquinone biosynthesis C-methylase UbiE
MKLNNSDYDEAPVREHVVALARRWGTSALDVGTGACACMALALAAGGLRVTAVDVGAGTLRIAQESVAGDLTDRIELRYMDAAHLRFATASCPVVVAFDALCHTANPGAVLSEMFRVLSETGVVIVVELNTAGRELTRHLDGGFEKTLPDLLAQHCGECDQFTHPHHILWLCALSPGGDGVPGSGYSGMDQMEVRW